MKLSPEAKQAIKTAIEQLRLLLVNDAMDTIREEVSKQLMDDGKNEGERLKKTFIQLAKAVINEPDDKPVSKVVLDAPELEVSCSNPFEEIQTEIKRLKAQVELLAMQTNCNLQTSVTGSATISSGGQSSRLIQAANLHSFKRIYAEIDKLTEEVKALRSSNKKLKKRVNTLEEWEKIHR
ncbi:hypothetical protein RLV03_000375 [Salmonella enterica subsp. enterica serovar Benin]|nr:hypothetical protein [Salmonella enterica subsp. enterica serovar Benin]ELD9381932.1 hypothetical protein [Salmonella enterica subsp. enterica serovar Benin]